MYTDGYTLATYFIKLQYVIKVTSCSCNGAWLVIIRSVWKHPGAHQYPVLVQEVFQQLLWPFGGCNRFLPIRIAGSNESRIFLYWLKISFQIRLSCIHDKCWILRNVITKPAISLYEKIADPSLVHQSFSLTVWSSLGGETSQEDDWLLIDSL